MARELVAMYAIGKPIDRKESIDPSKIFRCNIPSLLKDIGKLPNAEIVANTDPCAKRTVTEVDPHTRRIEETYMSGDWQITEVYSED